MEGLKRDEDASRSLLPTFSSGCIAAKAQRSARAPHGSLPNKYSERPEFTDRSAKAAARPLGRGEQRHCPAAERIAGPVQPGAPSPSKDGDAPAGASVRRSHQARQHPLHRLLHLILAQLRGHVDLLRDSQAGQQGRCPSEKDIDPEGLATSQNSVAAGLKLHAMPPSPEERAVFHTMPPHCPNSERACGPAPRAPRAPRG